MFKSKLKSVFKRGSSGSKSSFTAPAPAPATATFTAPATEPATKSQKKAKAAEDFVFSQLELVRDNSPPSGFKPIEKPLEALCQLADEMVPLTDTLFDQFEGDKVVEESFEKALDEWQEHIPKLVTAYFSLRQELKLGEDDGDLVANGIKQALRDILFTSSLQFSGYSIHGSADSTVKYQLSEDCDTIRQIAEENLGGEVNKILNEIINALRFAQDYFPSSDSKKEKLEFKSSPEQVEKASDLVQRFRDFFEGVQDSGLLFRDGQTAEDYRGIVDKSEESSTSLFNFLKEVKHGNWDEKQYDHLNDSLKEIREKLPSD